MKNSFLHNIALYIKENDLFSNDVKIILPNKRASLFLKNELIALTDKNSFLPQFLSIEDFSQQLADLSLLDSVNLQFELYHVYKTVVTSTQLDPFEKFIQWAPIVLQDFNEIDSYLIDADKLFDKLTALKRIEQWAPGKEPTLLSLNYLSFFETLKKLYKSFYCQLLEKQQAYQGLIYREAVKNTSIYCNNFNGKLIFVGFNALNKAEEVIIQEFLAQQKAEIFWDVDKTLLADNHPSTQFISHYKSTWPHYKNNTFNWETSSFKKPKNIQFIGAAKQVAQLKIAGQILESISENDKNYNNTALVLGDESLLNVALESLPKNVEKVNITMGYALQNIPLASLFTGLFKANINALKFNKTTELHYKDVESLLLHPYISKILDINNSDVTKRLIETIRKRNLIFVDFRKLKSTNSDIDFVFEPAGNNISKFLENLIDLINILKDNTVLTDLEKEYLYRFYTLFLELKTLESKFHFIDNLKTLQHFYNSLLRNEKLFFRGEPLSGLQIMGLLETRTLDFDNLIITSVNEGILPAGNTSNSFLPFAIKKAFGLPTYQEKDTVFSYHFFRLIQRAKSVYLIYNTEVDDFGASEKSRFLTQLELLKPSDITNKIVISNLESKPIEPRKIEVNSTIKKRLKEIAETGISPSAIELFIKNPLDFYFSKILRIKEVDTLEETIAHNTFGNVIHDALYQLYLPFLNINLTQESLKKISKNINKALEINFNKHYANGDIKTGKNKLYFEMAKSYIQKLVQHESNLLKKAKTIKLLALEEPLETIINVPNVNYPIKIKGVADRIDIIDGKLRILDYKTGAVDASKLKITNFDTFFNNENHTKALQLFMYAFMYARYNNLKHNFEAGIISFKKLNNYILKINFKTNNIEQDFNITQQRLDLFEVSLQDILSSIFNAETFIEKIQKNGHY